MFPVYAPVGFDERRQVAWKIGDVLK